MNPEEKYDEIIFDPLLRDYFGDSGFYNVGYWFKDTKNQEEACINLIDRTFGKFKDYQGAVLEVGSGLGASTERLAKFFPASNISAINISRKQLLVSQAKLPQITFLHMNGSKMTFEASSFDKIASIESVFHIDSRDEFFHEAYRTMKPGAELIFTDILFKENFSFHQLLVPAANVDLTLQEYPEKLKSAGFDKVDIVDITDHSWTPFCQYFLNWYKENANHRGIDIHQYQNTLDEIVEMRDRVVSNYLIVYAQKI